MDCIQPCDRERKTVWANSFKVFETRYICETVWDTSHVPTDVSVNSITSFYFSSTESDKKEKKSRDETNMEIFNNVWRRYNLYHYFLFLVFFFNFQFKIFYRWFFFFSRFFFLNFFIYSIPITQLPGTGDVLVLLIGHPVYHRGRKGGGGR